VIGAYYTYPPGPIRSAFAGARLCGAGEQYDPAMLACTCAPGLSRTWEGRCAPRWLHRVEGFGAVETSPSASGAAALATTMVLRGAVGTLIGAAVAPKGSEGIWGAIGFGSGALLGQLGILGMAVAALWKKAG
jgi:hypothetical protein